MVVKTRVKLTWRMVEKGMYRKVIAWNRIVIVMILTIHPPAMTRGANEGQDCVSAFLFVDGPQVVLVVRKYEFGFRARRVFKVPRTRKLRGANEVSELRSCRKPSL